MTTQAVKITGLQEAIDGLTIFQRARLKGSIVWSLEQFGFWLRNHEQQRLSYTFDRLNSFTRNAPLFKKPTKERPSLLFFLRDQAPGGNSPDRYLAPQVDGGPVYVTRFSRALRRSGAIGPNHYIMHWDEGQPKATPSFISALTSALTANAGPVRSGRQYARNLRSASKYFILGQERQQTRTYRNPGATRRDSGYEGYGIYTRKGAKLDLVYRILRQPPTVPAKYDWTYERMSALAEDQLPLLLFGKLSEF